MNDTEQRIAIAEACGWKSPNLPEVDALQIEWTTRGQHWLCPKGVLRSQHHLPDYLNDLNAMHEACESVPDFEWCKFWEHLETVTGTRVFCKNITDDCKGMIGATADQRAEAFLRTLNLWKP